MPHRPDFSRPATENYTYLDWFELQWTWVASAGGAVAPGVILLDDINNWKRCRFGLCDWGSADQSGRFPEMNTTPIGFASGYRVGCIQRLISVLGGYTEGMFALLEPDGKSVFCAVPTL